jgi:DNA-binding MarR family transcriptional regulator
MRETSIDGADRVTAGVERELAVLIRHLERLGRHSDLYAGMGGAGRAGYLLLMTLEDAGSATIGTLAATLGLDASTVTRQIAAMEAEGLVDRAVDPHDRRCSIISPSERGRSLLHSVRTRRSARVDALLEGWSARDRRDLARLLERLNGALAARPRLARPAAESPHPA